MAKADYKCCVCGRIEEQDISADADGAPCGAWETDDARCPGTIHRVWGPVHTGRGSSGEPPR